MFFLLSRGLEPGPSGGFFAGAFVLQLNDPGVERIDSGVGRRRPCHSQLSHKTENLGVRDRHERCWQKPLEKGER